MKQKTLYAPPAVEIEEISVSAGIATSLSEVDEYILFEGWETL